MPLLPRKQERVVRGVLAGFFLLAANISAGSAVDDNIVRWQAGKPGSETVNHSGVESRMLVSHGFAVRAYVRVVSRYNEVVLTVGDDTSQPANFDPRSVTLEVITPAHKELKPVSPEALVRQMREEEKKISEADAEQQVNAPRLRRQRRWMPQSGEPSLSASAQLLIEKLKEEEAYVLAQAFPTGRVPAQQIRAGSVFFPPQHYAEATAHIPIGGVVFEIPFTAH